MGHHTRSSAINNGQGYHANWYNVSYEAINMARELVTAVRIIIIINLQTSSYKMWQHCSIGSMTDDEHRTAARGDRDITRCHVTGLHLHDPRAARRQSPRGRQVTRNYFGELHCSGVQRLGHFRDSKATGKPRVGVSISESQSKQVDVTCYIYL